MSNKPKLEESTVRKATKEEVEHYKKMIEKESNRLKKYRKLGVSNSVTHVY